jgi:hypothetical protein
MVFDTYYQRWRGFYRTRLSRREWLRAAFLMPWNGRHALRTAVTLGGALAGYATSRVRRLLRSQPAGA